MVRDVMSAELRRKVTEELALGANILGSVCDIQSKLERAREAVVDRSGGGMAKYNYINTVQEQVTHLREDVELFYTSVEEINVPSAERIGNLKLEALFPAGTNADNECMQLYIDADAVIMERITTLQDTANRVEVQIKETMGQLEEIIVDSQI